MFKRLVAVFALLTVMATSVSAAPEAELTLGTAGNTSHAQAIAFGPNGEIYVAGRFSGTFGSLTASDALDLFVQRIERDGTVVWEYAYPDASEFPDRLVALWVDGAGNLWFGTNHELGVLGADGTLISAPGYSHGLANAGTAAPNPIGSGLYEAGGKTTLVRRQPDGSVDWTHDLSVDAPGEFPFFGPGATAVPSGGVIALANAATDNTPSGSTSIITRLADDGSELWTTHLDDKFAYFSTTPETLQILGDEVHVIVFADDNPEHGGLSGRDPERFVIDLDTGEFLRGIPHDETWYCQSDLRDDGFAPAIGRLRREACGGGYYARQAWTPGQVVTLSPDGKEGAGRMWFVNIDDPELGTLAIGRFSMTGDPTRRLLQVVESEPDERFGALAWDPEGNLWYVGSDDGRAVVRLNPWTHGFSDIVRSWQDGPVFWLKKNGITQGVSETEFAPERNITRGELAAMIYRAHGNPAPGSDHPFTDVLRSWQDDPISWMYNNAITTGVNDNEFAPDRPVTRGELAAFWWRMAGFPVVDTPHGFVDVVAPWQQAAVRWLKSTGITTGVNATEFAPDRPVTRGEVAAFLERYNTTIGLPLD